MTTVDRENVAVWIDAATGKVRATRRGLPLLRPEPEQLLLGDRGQLVSITNDWTTLVAVDLATGKVAQLPAGDGGFFEGVRATRWLSDAVVVVRRRAATVELLRIDVAAMLR